VDPVRIGIVGCGSVMTAYMQLIEVLEREGQARVTMACDTREDRGAFMSENYGVQSFTTRYQDLVTSDDVDLVMVLTAMPVHGEITKAALEAGKHVLVEKPMSVDLEEGAALVELARQSSGHLLPAPHVVLSETYRTFWKLIADGEIGRVVNARARYGWSGPAWGPWFYGAGGGSLFDLGVYNVTTLTGLLGPAKRVSAMMGVAIPEREVEGQRVKVEAEDNAHLLVDFGDEVYAVITTGFTMQRSRGPSIELYGTEGTLQMLGYDWGPEGYELWKNEVGAWQVYASPDRKWPWTDGLRHLVTCIREGTSPIITPEHGYHVLEIMTRAKESARDGVRRELQSTFTPPQFDAAGKAIAPHLIHDPTR
jgi:predicted dehydrogenase